MKKYLFFLFFLWGKSFAQLPSDSLLNMFITQEQKQMEAIAVGDKAIWDAALHDSVIITIEDGSRISKSKFLDDLKPLPIVYKGMIKVIEPTLKVYGNTAVITFVNDEYLDLYNQHIHTQYRQTDTWVKENENWKIVAMQFFEIPKNPPQVPIGEIILKKYTGNYQLSDKRKAVVKLENGKLYVIKSNGSPVELLAETENVFFRKGDGRVRILFIKDITKKYAMIERRAGEDLVWRRQ